jgi:hypothetical protein
MATATKTAIKAPRKKKVRLSPTIKRGNKIVGPDFTGWETWTGAEYLKFQRNARDWYYENYKVADLLPDVWAWMKENNYTAEQIKHAKAGDVSIVVAISCKLLRTGMPDYNKAHDDYWQTLPGTSGVVKPSSVWIKARLEEAIEKGKLVVVQEAVVEKAKANVYVPTIQERISEQASNAAEAIDEWLEGFITDKKKFNPKGFDFKSHFVRMGVTQAHARKIIGFYEAQLAEFRELQNMPTAAQLKKMDPKAVDLLEQLKEGYSHLTKQDVSNYITALETLVDACMLIVDASKATRKTRTPKPKSADKLISKLKYCKVDNKNSLASINPVEIVGASELWVFNIKTRKLGKYVAQNIDPSGMARAGSGLSVKGATIIGFNEELSVQKTLRKPELQLKEFKAAGKVALRKFLENINTTDTKLNGRINADTVLLKVN